MIISRLTTVNENFRVTANDSLKFGSSIRFR